MKTETVRCQSCGAPLKVRPGTAFITCEYCGANNYFKKSLPEGEVELTVRIVRCDEDSFIFERLFENWIHHNIPQSKDRRRNYQITRKELVYIPIYVFKVFTKTFWEGYTTYKPSFFDAIHKRDGRHSEIYWQGVFAGDIDFPHAETISYDHDAFEMIKPDELSEINHINITKDFELAWEEAQDFIFNKERKGIRRHIPRFTYTETTFELKESFIGYLPLMLIEYNYQSRNYSTVFNCYTRRFKGDRPKKRVSKTKKILIPLIIGGVILACLITCVVVGLMETMG